jgi:hypothetical protein
MPVADPATRFAPQLQQLRDMGFTDEARNLQVRRCRGGRREGRGERGGEGREPQGYRVREGRRREGG